LSSQNEENSLPGQQALEHLRAIVAGTGLEADVVAGSQPLDEISVDITGPDASYFVGPHGQCLDSLQYLLNLIVNKGREQRVRIAVDADKHRARRIQTLTKFAHQLADQVISNGQEAVTDPMNPMERRIIHTVLAERKDVQTYSEGDEPGRYVVVSPSTDDNG
jgi:spoIIIJ-associated protein